MSYVIEFENNYWDGKDWGDFANAKFFNKKSEVKKQVIALRSTLPDEGFVNITSIIPDTVYSENLKFKNDKLFMFIQDNKISSCKSKCPFNGLSYCFKKDLDNIPQEDITDTTCVEKFILNYPFPVIDVTSGYMSKEIATALKALLLFVEGKLVLNGDFCAEFKDVTITDVPGLDHKFYDTKFDVVDLMP